MLNYRDKSILFQIIKRCDRILDKVLFVIQEEFNSNDDLKEIVSFNFFQIGVLSNWLSNEFIAKYNEVPWKQIKGMRNRIVHGYDAINLDIIWDTAQISIPSLKENCLEILELVKC